jgi:hypothetical protein
MENIMDFTITFTEQELEVVLRCLAEQPYKVAAPVIQKLQVEIQKAQQAIQAAEAKKAVEGPEDTVTEAQSADGFKKY